MDISQHKDNIKFWYEKKDIYLLKYYYFWQNKKQHSLLNKYFLFTTPALSVKFLVNISIIGYIPRKWEKARKKTELVKAILDPNFEVEIKYFKKIYVF